METLDKKIHGILSNGSVDYGIFYIRYGPAVIFSNIVPGLDVNFIDPKYTEADPYSIKETPSYQTIVTYTNQLKDSNPAGLAELILEMLKILNVDTNNKSELDKARDKIEILFITDRKATNELQMFIYYENNAVLVECTNRLNKYNGNIIKPISQIITDRESRWNKERV